MARKTTKRTVRQSKPWFVPVRGSYLPTSGLGWATYVPYVGFLVLVGMRAYSHAGDIIDKLLWAIPLWVTAIVVMTWFARKKS